MKKFVVVIGMILTFLFIYLLQVNFFSWFNMAGVKPNLLVIFILIIGLFSGRSVGTVCGAAFGLAIDFFIGKGVGINVITLGIIGFLGGYLDKNFSKDSRLTMITMVVLATFIYEISTYLLNYFINLARIDIFLFIRTLIIEMIFNAILTIIIYPLIIKNGYKIEENFKENNILTRYF